MDDNGYDISDYHDVDPLFGTLEELDTLIAGLHERGIKLIMDLVVNHTSDEHPWFVESRDPASPKRDWYCLAAGPAGPRAAAPRGPSRPTGSRSFSGSAWHYDERSGEYYLHLFSPKQPDLNWENPEVRQAIYAMMNWWVDRGVDGFRMDVINLISKRRSWSTASRSPGTGRRRGVRVHGQRAAAGGVPGRDESRGRAGRAQPAHRRGDAGVDHRSWPGGDRPGRPRAQHGLHLRAREPRPAARRAASGTCRTCSLPALKQNLADWQVGLADVGWNSLYWDNHDQPRAVSRFGDDAPEHRVNSAKTLATVQHMHQGTPYVYQGEELGMTNTYFADIGQYRDIESVNYHADALSLGLEAETVLNSLSVKSRDNARTPMQWDDTSHAGFTDGIPWLPVNPNYVTINAAAAMADPDSVFHHFRKLIELRRDLPVVAHGRFELLLPDHEQIWALTRTLDDQVLVMVANCSSEAGDRARTERCPISAGPQVLLATHPSTSTEQLAPWESRIYLRG